MKLETKYTEVHGQLGEKTIQSTISQAKLGKLWDMLQNPYKNNIGSIVREIVSNCFDSHREAQISDAVRIKFSKDDSGFYISFIDVGVGMSPERVEKIYSTYLESTKEESNDFIGAFGIGSKSPLSYQDLFYINTRFDGIEYNYIMRKGEMGPAIDLLMSSDTVERNGTEIKIYIKNEEDLRKFLSESFEQLHYFTNVVIDLEDIKLLYVNQCYSVGRSILNEITRLEQDYNLIEGEHFVYRTNTKFNDLHLSIGGVYYPIDWNNINSNRITTPVALKFEIGELDVIQTREDVRYTDKVVKAIEDKIKLLQTEFVELYNKNAEEGYELKSFVENKFRSDVIYIEGHQLIVRDLLNDRQSELNSPQIKDFPLKFNSLKQANSFIDYFNITFQYFGVNPGQQYNDKFADKLFGNIKVVKTYSSNGSMRSPGNIPYQINLNISNKSLSSLLKMQNTTYFKLFRTTEENFSVKTNKYIFNKLRPELNCENVYVVRVPKKVGVSAQSLKVFYKEFNERTGIQLSFRGFKDMMDIVFKEIKTNFESIFTLDYDKVKVDEAWWKEYKSDNYSTADYDRTLMAFDKFLTSSVNGNWNRKDYRMDIKTILESKSVTILLTKDEQSKFCSNNTDYKNTPLEKLVMYNNQFKEFLSKKQIQLYATATRNYDKIIKARQEHHPVYTLEEFIKSKKMQQRLLGKIATYLKINQYIKEFDMNNQGCGFESLDIQFSIMNEQLLKDYNEIVNLTRGEYRSMFTVDHMEVLLKEFDEMELQYAVYDTEMLRKFNNVMEFLKDSQLHLVMNNPVSLYKFTLTYKPKKTAFMLDKHLLKHNVTIDDMCNSFNFGIDSKTDEEKLQFLRQRTNYNYNIHKFETGQSYYNSVKGNDLVLNIMLQKYFENQRSYTITIDDVVFKKLEEPVDQSIEEIVEESIDLNV